MLNFKLKDIKVDIIRKKGKYNVTLIPTTEQSKNKLHELGVTCIDCNFVRGNYIIDVMSNIRHAEEFIDFFDNFIDIHHNKSNSIILSISSNFTDNVYNKSNITFVEDGGPLTKMWGMKLNGRRIKPINKED